MKQLIMNNLICFFVHPLFSGKKDGQLLKSVLVKSQEKKLCFNSRYYLPGDTGEVMGMKGCFRINEGEPLK